MSRSSLQLSTPTVLLATALVSGCGVVSGSGLAIGTGSSSERPAPSERSQPSLLDSSATKAWREVLRSRESELDKLYQRVNDLPQAGSTSPDQHAQWALETLENDKLADVAANCEKGVYKEEGIELEPRRIFLKASTMCPLIRDRKELLEKTVRAWGLAIIEDRIAEQANQIERMEKSGRVPVSLLEKEQTPGEMKAYVASFAEKTFASIGEGVPENALQKSEDLFQRRRSVITKLASAKKIDKPSKGDPGAENAIRNTFEKRFDVKKVLMQDDEWRIVKNDFGILLRRYKDATVLVKAKDGSFCALVPASVGQQYETMGEYEKAYGVDESIEAFPVKCP